MLEFLAMFGFDDDEARAQEARVREVFNRLGLTDEDIQRAKVRMNTYYDMELRGVRKLFGIILKDVCNTVMMRDDGREKVIHVCMSPGLNIMGSAIMDNCSDVGMICPNMTYMSILGGVFGKYTPILEAAEKEWLKSGAVAHCGMVKSRVGLIGLGLIPKPDLTMTTGYACETSPKVNELLEEVYGIPACYVDTCPDRELSEYPDSRRITVFAAKSMRAAAGCIERVTGFRITDDMVWKALKLRKTLDEAMERYRRVMRESDPIPFRSTHLSMWMAVDLIPYTEEGIAEAVDAFTVLCDELEERRSRGVGATPKGAPRVLSMFPYHHTDPRWEALANEKGIAIVAFDFEAMAIDPSSGAGIVDPNDPYEVVAQHLHSSFTQPLGARVRLVLDLCRRLGVDGVFYHNHLGCRYAAGDALVVRDAIIKELGIPVLMLEWDNFDPRSYNHQQYEAKLETFRSMMGAGV
ncbi:MAG: 2-hydroxyacyl-CoA dehydratase [Actinobacteria bacterium]|nr:2-hydroxyacyl-CoA dehydratase [Actinomycetota bacterium]